MLKDPALSTARAKLIKLRSLTMIAPVTKARSLTSEVLTARVIAEARRLCPHRTLRLQFLELVTTIFEYEENHTQNFLKVKLPLESDRPKSSMNPQSIHGCSIVDDGDRAVEKVEDAAGKAPATEIGERRDGVLGLGVPHLIAF
ncbi:hypothetical protein L1887_05250 [Cichorium endivia]|nr:hypothetical protein L1887_05250 [Cichorium endivia]